MTEYIERPALRYKRADHEELCAQLRVTAENGKALVSKGKIQGTVVGLLKREGYKLISRRRVDGTFANWVERIEAPRG